MVVQHFLPCEKKGTKKWITNGTWVFFSCWVLHGLVEQTCSFADYFTVGCKTEDGFTVILVERGPGVETKPIKTSYSPTAGTAYITFDNVRVPIENTLGEEGGGIFVILRYLLVTSAFVDAVTERDM